MEYNIPNPKQEEKGISELRSTSKPHKIKRKQNETIVTAVTLCGAAVLLFFFGRLKKLTQQNDSELSNQAISDLACEIQETRKLIEQTRKAQEKQIDMTKSKQGGEKKQEANQERRALFLTAALVAVITITSAPGQFSFLGASLGIILILVLLIYCRPGIKEGWLALVFSTVFSWGLLLVFGMVLNYWFPDNPCPTHLTANSKLPDFCVYAPFSLLGNKVVLTIGDMAEFTIWVVGTVVVWLFWFAISWISEHRHRN